MIPAAPPGSSGLAIDGRSLDGLKAQAARDPRAAVREAARQFEAMFMNELLKGMRASTASMGAMDNEGSRVSSEMLDAQWAQALSGRPGGLAEALERQLGRHLAQGSAPGLAPGPAPHQALPAAHAVPAADPQRVGPRDAGATRTPPGRGTVPPPLAGPVSALQRDFVDRHAALARQAQELTGVPAAFMVAQAALESGWGRRQIVHADGSPTHNLFGIKATPGWKGPVAEVTTTEYIGGQARKVVQRFRAYASAAESFADYARLLTNSARYRPVIAQAQDASAFAQGLQRAGYATDPNYADKLSRVINATLRLQRSVA